MKPYKLMTVGLGCVLAFSVQAEKCPPVAFVTRDTMQAVCHDQKDSVKNAINQLPGSQKIELVNITITCEAIVKPGTSNLYTVNPGTYLCDFRR